jgi:predicted GIY-YIG superfamily endonuclease
MFYVYVLHSLEDHGLYFGFSTNLKKRIAEHEHGASHVSVEDAFTGLPRLDSNQE